MERDRPHPDLRLYLFPSPFFLFTAFVEHGVLVAFLP